MKLTHSLIALPLLAIAGLAAADKPAAPAAAPAARDAAAAPAAPGKTAGPPRPWKDMTGEERGKYMKEVVTPQMKVAFQKFDADEFEKFGCDTCHGSKAKARKFKMPAPELYALPATPEGFGKLMEKKPKMMKFMAEVVKPQMAAMLGLPEFDPKKPEAGGFGCTGCHTMKK